MVRGAGFFLSIAKLGKTAEALNGLGQALWWLGETRDSVDYRERAYAEFRRRPNPVEAATIALVLCVHFRRIPRTNAAWPAC
jgi:hypothetical protein